MVGPGSRARCSSAKTPDWRRASLRNWRVSAGPVYPLPSDLEFTGGRFVPGIAGEIAHEQLHCYAFARRNVAGKRGIDVACGEGHRSALMAGVATVVTGIDVDTVVSFETIEHLPRAYQPRMLAEIARALAKDRVLIVLFGAAFTKTQLQARDGTVVPRNSAVLAGASSSSISRLEHGAAAARGVPSPVEDGLRDQLVGAMPGRRIVRPGVDDDLVEAERCRELLELRGDLLARAHDGALAEALDDRALCLGVRVGRRSLR